MAKHISHRTPREVYYEQLAGMTAKKFIEQYYEQQAAKQKEERESK